jgi:hypothetical protein
MAAKTARKTRRRVRITGIADIPFGRLAAGLTRETPPCFPGDYSLKALPVN